jgi:chromate transporter
MKKTSLWQLFAVFFRTGLFTFGGGYAMIAILQEELVNNRKWITNNDMLDMIVVAESTPGVIAVNTATSIGYKQRGILGAIVATLGVILPSFLIISALSYVISAFQSNVWYQSAFKGIQACVTVLVVNAFTKMFKQIEQDVYNYIALVVAFAVATFTNLNVIFLILCGALCGLLITIIKPKAKAEKPLVVADVQDIASQDNQTGEVDQ